MAATANIFNRDSLLMYLAWLHAVLGALTELQTPNLKTRVAAILTRFYLQLYL
jgi:hypothetical protein